MKKGRAGFDFFKVGEHLTKINFMETMISGVFIDKDLSRQLTRQNLIAQIINTLLQGKKIIWWVPTHLNYFFALFHVIKI